MTAVVTNLPAIGRAIGLTLALFVGTLAVGTVGGLIVGLAHASRIRLVAMLALVYSWFWRVLPVLLMLYFAFYVLPSAGIKFSALTTGVLTFGASTAAYMGEIVRGGLAAVPVEQREAAASLGMSRIRTFRRVVLPYVVRSIAGPYISQAILVLKGTSLAGVIGVAELTLVTRSLINTTYQVWPFLVVDALVYLVLSLVLSIVQRIAEERTSW
jgi:His/Glu/Gln/Arg/opine family amino acid ABC transporter permease subunit